MKTFTLIGQDSDDNFVTVSVKAESYSASNDEFEKKINMNGLFIISIFETADEPIFHFQE